MTPPRPEQLKVDEMMEIVTPLITEMEHRRDLDNETVPAPMHLELLRRVEELLHRIRVLEEHVRHLGNMSDRCTFTVLNRICDYCECSRQKPQ